MSKIERYNTEKRGSFQITLKFTDWELSITIGAIRKAKLEAKTKGHKTYLERLEKKFSEALGQVLKAEFKDLKLENENLDAFIKEIERG